LYDQQALSDAASFSINSMCHRSPWRRDISCTGEQKTFQEASSEGNRHRPACRISVDPDQINDFLVFLKSLE
jgi:hypothetical protein